MDRLFPLRNRSENEQMLMTCRPCYQPVATQSKSLKADQVKQSEANGVVDKEQNVSKPLVPLKTIAKSPAKQDKSDFVSNGSERSDVDLQSNGGNDKEPSVSKPFAPLKSIAKSPYSANQDKSDFASDGSELSDINPKISLDDDLQCSDSESECSPVKTISPPREATLERNGHSRLESKLFFSPAESDLCSKKELSPKVAIPVIDAKLSTNQSSPSKVLLIENVESSPPPPVQRIVSNDSFLIVDNKKLSVDDSSNKSSPTCSDSNPVELVKEAKKNVNDEKIPKPEIGLNNCTIVTSSVHTEEEAIHSPGHVIESDSISSQNGSKDSDGKGDKELDVSVPKTSQSVSPVSPIEKVDFTNTLTERKWSSPRSFQGFTPLESQSNSARANFSPIDDAEWGITSPNYTICSPKKNNPVPHDANVSDPEIAVDTAHNHEMFEDNIKNDKETEPPEHGEDKRNKSPTNKGACIEASDSKRSRKRSRDSLVEKKGSHPSLEPKVRKVTTTDNSRKVGGIQSSDGSKRKVPLTSESVANKKTSKLVEIDLGFFSKPVDQAKNYSSKMKAVMDFKTSAKRRVDPLTLKAQSKENRPPNKKSVHSSKEKSNRKDPQIKPISSNDNKTKVSRFSNSLLTSKPLLKSSADFESTQLKKQFALRRELLSCVFN